MLFEDIQENTLENNRSTSHLREMIDIQTDEHVTLLNDFTESALTL